MYKACTRATSLVPNLQKFRELPDFQNNFEQDQKLYAILEESCWKRVR